MKVSVSSSGDPLADEILRYLLEHPEAKDTIDGIADWWLTGRTMRQGISEVEIALHHLVDLGLVDVAVRKDDKRLYCLKREKTQDD